MPSTKNSPRRVGLWLIGALGGVGTTITLGLLAMARGKKSTTGLVTALPVFDGLDLPAAEDFIVGGHDIRQGSFAESAEEFRANSGVFDADLIAALRPDLDAATARVKPGTKLGAGKAIDKMGTWGDSSTARTAGEAVDRIAADLRAFIQAERIDHLIVLNVASTEPPFLTKDVHHDWPKLAAALPTGGADLLPASSLYAIAALRDGHTYVNFTPSLGASIPALYALAESTGALHAGKDGKTGETLMKTVLGPMFANRNLEVMSWVGHNIFGNRDGVILDDPVNKSSKVETKDKVVTQILGYKPSTLVTIEYIPDMGDWKTAWDHIHFEGFLGTKMTLQFTWQGCDSTPGPPPAARSTWTARRLRERRQAGSADAQHLASFFKGPEGVEENDFFKQFAIAGQVRGEGEPGDEAKFPTRFPFEASD